MGKKFGIYNIEHDPSNEEDVAALQEIIAANPELAFKLLNEAGSEFHVSGESPHIDNFNNEYGDEQPLEDLVEDDDPVDEEIIEGEEPEGGVAVIKTQSPHEDLAADLLGFKTNSVKTQSPHEDLAASLLGFKPSNDNRMKNLATIIGGARFR